MKKFLFIAFILILSGVNAFALPFVKKETTEIYTQAEQYQEVTQQANVLYAENNINQAKDLLLSIPENQRTAQNWLLIGNILQDQGKSDEAVFMYKKAVSVNDEYYKAYYNLGNIYLSENKPNMAAEQYSKVVKLNPDYAYGHYNLACAYIKLGKYSKAKFELYNAIDLKSSEPDFYYNLIYILKKQNKEKEAKKYIEIYNKLTGENV
ncbi:tetratricopeptide repeat protein [bacterium]|nr:tetratricopeptide repeat protein [bacterium]